VDLPEEIQIELDVIESRIEVRKNEFKLRFGGVFPPGYDREYISDLLAVKRNLLAPYTEKKAENKIRPIKAVSKPLKQRQKEAIQRAIKQLRG